MKKVLLVSKALVPPWNDSSKNLARDIAFHCPSVRFHALTVPHYRLGPSNIREEDLYSRQGALRNSLWNQTKIFFRLLKPDDIDIAHFFFAPNRNTSRMAALAMNMKGTQASIHTVCSMPENFDSTSELLFADITVTVSETARARFVAHGARSVRCIHPGVALQNAPSKEDRKVLRRTFDLPENKLLALYAGDLEFSNAAQTLVESLPELMPYKNMDLVFCTRVKTERAKAAAGTLKMRIAELGAESRVHLVPPQDDLLPLISAMDLMILTPDTLYAKMDLPLVLLEAMSLGIPAVLSDLPSLREAFDDATAGLFVPHSDAKALAHAILDMFDNEPKRLAYGRAAMDIARERFSLERLGRDYEALYREIGGRP